jgi:multicomponent Na+:H+ antiporter subunit D
VYYIAGADMIRGTWVQYTWIALSLVTVFMGSMLAYRENVLKKRLAYSTVSQVSYILFGLSVLHPVAFVGAMMHVIFHSLVKNTLFISAGAIIYKTGRTKVNELIGIGKEMPIVMWCFTLVSLTLVGIPPTSAFVSKWYLATGALAAEIPVASWLGPVILLISALLTAGYLLTISIKGFLPGEDYDYQHLVKKEPTWMMLVPLVLMTALAVIFGIYPAGLIRLITDIASTVL